MLRKREGGCRKLYHLTCHFKGMSIGGNWTYLPRGPVTPGPTAITDGRQQIRKKTLAIRGKDRPGDSDEDD